MPALARRGARRRCSAVNRGAGGGGASRWFDYRVLHRGLANPSRERAVAYLVLATDGADGQNFCQMGSTRAPAHVEQMCLWSD